MPNAILGMTGSGNWATEERPKDYYGQVAYRFPNLAPAMAVMSRMKGKKKSVSDPEFKVFTQEEVPGYMLINNAAGYAVGATVLTVDQGAGIKANTFVRKGDRLFNLRTSETMEVSADPDPTTNDITVLRGGSLGSTAVAILDDDQLVILSPAHEEGSARPKAIGWNPDLGNNYTQIIKEGWELTGTAAAISSLRSGPDPAAKRKKDAFEMFWKKAERMFFLNIKNERTGAGGFPNRSTGGIYHFMPAANVVTVGGNITEDLFLSQAEQWFRNSDTGEIAIFGGSVAIQYLNQAMAKRVTFQGDSSTKSYGIKFSSWQTPFGIVHMNVHPLLKRDPLLRNDYFAINFEDLEMRYLEGRDLKHMDLKLEENGEDVKAGMWIAEWGFFVPFGNKNFWYKDITGYA